MGVKQQRATITVPTRPVLSWNHDATPRILRSEEEILEAERAGELTIQRTSVIVNAPIVHSHPAPR